LGHQPVVEAIEDQRWHLLLILGPLDFSRGSMSAVYIIHLSVVFIVGFYVIKFDVPILGKYFDILILSLKSSVLVYVIVVR